MSTASDDAHEMADELACEVARVSDEVWWDAAWDKRAEISRDLQMAREAIDAGELVAIRKCLVALRAWDL